MPSRMLYSVRGLSGPPVRVEEVEVEEEEEGTGPLVLTLSDVSSSRMSTCVAGSWLERVTLSSFEHRTHRSKSLHWRHL